MSRGPVQPTTGGRYDRHDPKWSCGDAASGDPCPLGPSRLGVCSAQFDCQPAKQGDRWLCTRPESYGGPCECGPTPSGDCGRPRRDCVPQPLVRQRRGLWVIAAMCGCLGLLLVMLNSKSRPDMFAPGPLTDSHAQILKRESLENRCVACHPRGTSNVSQWFSVMLGAGAVTHQLPAHSDEHSEHVASSQSELCLNCHRDTLGQDAMLAHGVASDVLATYTNRQSDADEHAIATGSIPAHLRGEIACATCHREHHGSHHDLTAITNRQCATCHRQQFADFAATHPEFSDWPQAATSSVVFTHNRHMSVHFPEGKQEFSCRDCHEQGVSSQRVGSDPITTRVGFEKCASCHQSKILSGTEEGVTLVGLPMLENDLLEEQDGISGAMAGVVHRLFRRRGTGLDLPAALSRRRIARSTDDSGC